MILDSFENNHDRNWRILVIEIESTVAIDFISIGCSIGSTSIDKLFHV
jgi:hypothetical protein